MQQPIKLKAEENYGIYHTTIPMYVTILLSTCALLSVYYRKRHTRPLAKTMKENEENNSDMQAVDAVPGTRRVDPDHLPAQFTTSVFNRRCSTGGGVTLG